MTLSAVAVVPSDHAAHIALRPTLTGVTLGFGAPPAPSAFCPVRMLIASFTGRHHGPAVLPIGYQPSKELLRTRQGRFAVNFPWACFYWQQRPGPGSIHVPGGEGAAVSDPELIRSPSKFERGGVDFTQTQRMCSCLGSTRSVSCQRQGSMQIIIRSDLDFNTMTLTRMSCYTTWYRITTRTRASGLYHHLSAGWIHPEAVAAKRPPGWTF